MFYIILRFLLLRWSYLRVCGRHPASNDILLAYLRISCADLFVDAQSMAAGDKIGSPIGCEAYVHHVQVQFNNIFKLYHKHM